MQWKKLGLIKAPSIHNTWQDNSLLQPIPLLLDDMIRVYVGFRDEYGVSRIGYVDLDGNNPLEVISISKEPSLDIGRDGMFDENGVCPTAIIKTNEGIRLYYGGYSQGKKVRFLAFTGLAISTDGEHFERYQETPVTDRVKGEELFRDIHSILYDGRKYRVWYGGGNLFMQGITKTHPVYDVKYMESEDGIHFPSQGKMVLQAEEGCYRASSPYVIFEGNKYKMFYCNGMETVPFQLAYAESTNGIDWETKDLNLTFSKGSFDSQMMAYPSFIRNKEGRGFLFYNGNNYGKDGFGCAELI